MIFNGNKLLVTEASPETGSPYLGVKNGKKIYNGPFSYYIFPEDKSDEVYDLRNERYINLTSIKSNAIYNNNFHEQSLLRLENETVFLKNYSQDFEKIKQPNNYSCVSTSFAMALKYLHNINKINLDHSMRDLSTINSKLFDMMNCSSEGCFTPSIGRGLRAFSNQYCNMPVVCHDGQWWPDLNFQTIVNEINENFPLVGIYSNEPFNKDKIFTHACPIVGYKTFSYGGKYTIVVDPLQAAKIEIYWNETNVKGAFVLYVGY